MGGSVVDARRGDRMWVILLMTHRINRILESAFWEITKVRMICADHVSRRLPAKPVLHPHRRMSRLPLFGSRVPFSVALPEAVRFRQGFASFTKPLYCHGHSQNGRHAIAIAQLELYVTAHHVVLL